MTWDTMRSIKRLGLATARNLGHDVNIIYRFDKRLTVTVGQAELCEDWRMIIRLSPSLWELTSHDDRRETIVHEVCHLTSALEEGYFGMEELPHCDVWMEHMEYVGYSSPKVVLCL